jgi:hypothetical protein
MILVKSDERSEAGLMPDEKLMSDMNKFNDELARAGALLAAEGLKPSAKGFRVRYGDGKLKVIDGPFAEAKDLVAGFWLISAKSKAEAIEWAKRAPFQGGEVEIRPLFEMEDFPVDPAEKPDGWREKEQQFRDSTGPAGAARKPGDGRTRWIGFLKADEFTESGAMPEEKSLAATGALIEEMTSKGVMLSGEGLKPSAAGARVRYAGSKRTVVDGPFTEAKELVAGYLVYQTATKEEAVEWTKRFVKIHVDGVHAVQGECEARAFFEAEDFAAK